MYRFYDSSEGASSRFSVRVRGCWIYDTKGMPPKLFRFHSLNTCILYNCEIKTKQTMWRFSVKSCIHIKNCCFIIVIWKTRLIRNKFWPTRVYPVFLEEGLCKINSNWTNGMAWNHRPVIPALGKLETGGPGVNSILDCELPSKPNWSIRSLASRILNVQ